MGKIIGKSMRKEDWVSFYAEENGTTKTAAAGAINEFESTFKAAMEAGYLPIVGGIFTTKVTETVRTIRDPHTGNVMAENVKCNRAVFKPTTTVKDIVKSNTYDSAESPLL